MTDRYQMFPGKDYVREIDDHGFVTLFCGDPWRCMPWFCEKSIRDPGNYSRPDVSKMYPLDWSTE